MGACYFIKAKYILRERFSGRGVFIVKQRISQKATPGQGYPLNVSDRSEGPPQQSACCQKNAFEETRLRRGDRGRVTLLARDPPASNQGSPPNQGCFMVVRRDRKGLLRLRFTIDPKVICLRRFSTVGSPRRRRAADKPVIDYLHEPISTVGSPRRRRPQTSL